MKKFFALSFLFMLIVSAIAIAETPKQVVLSGAQWTCPSQCFQYQECFFNDNTQNTCIDMENILENSQCSSCLNINPDVKQFVDNNWLSCYSIFVEDIVNCIMAKNPGFDRNEVKFYASMKMVYTSTSSWSESICAPYSDNLGLYWGCLNQKNHDPSCLFDFIAWQKGFSFGNSICSGGTVATGVDLNSYCTQKGYNLNADCNSFASQAQQGNFCAIDGNVLSCSQSGISFSCSLCGTRKDSKQFKEACTTPNGEAGTCLYSRYDLGDDSPDVCKSGLAQVGNCDYEQKLFCCPSTSTQVNADGTSLDGNTIYNCAPSTTSATDMVSCRIQGQDSYTVQDFLNIFYRDTTPVEIRNLADNYMDQIGYTVQLANCMGLPQTTDSNCQGSKYFPNVNTCPEADRRNLNIPVTCCTQMEGEIFKNGKLCVSSAPPAPAVSPTATGTGDGGSPQPGDGSGSTGTGTGGW